VKYFAGLYEQVLSPYPLPAILEREDVTIGTDENSTHSFLDKYYGFLLTLNILLNISRVRFLLS